MEKLMLTQENAERFREHLREEERSPATVDKYMRDIGRFYDFAADEEVTKETVVAYKKNLIKRGYAARSVNSMLSAINCFFCFLGRNDLRVRNIRLQKSIYCAEKKELRKEEYMRLLSAAGNRPRLRMILQTICATGIRISELSYFTVEAVMKSEVPVSCKNKKKTTGACEIQAPFQ